MWILILEAAIALGLLVFIVWWTMAPVKKREDAQARNPEQQAVLPEVTGAQPESSNVTRKPDE